MSPSGHFRAYNFITGKYIIMHLKWWHKFLRIIKDHILCAMPTKLVLLYDDYLFHHAISNKWLSFMTTFMTNGSALCNTKETDYMLPPVKWIGNPPHWINSVAGSINIMKINALYFCLSWNQYFCCLFLCQMAGWKEATRNKIYHNVWDRTLEFPDLIFDILKNLRYKEVILLYPGYLLI